MYCQHLNIMEVEQVTERLTEDYFDDMQKITRHYAKSNNIDLNTGGNDFQDIIDKLAEYETAEEEGRLVVLPCNVGDTVYLIDDIDCVFERESIVTEIEIDKDGVTIMIQDEIPICSSGYNLSDFGEIVFLTREEAEKALKEIKKEEK